MRTLRSPDENEQARHCRFIIDAHRIIVVFAIQRLPMTAYAHEKITLEQFRRILQQYPSLVKRISSESSAKSAFRSKTPDNSFESLEEWRLRTLPALLRSENKSKLGNKRPYLTLNELEDLLRCKMSIVSANKLSQS